MPYGNLLAAATRRGCRCSGMTARMQREDCWADLSGWEPIANDTRLGAFQEIRP